jgi:hypothetical protein
MRQRKRCCEIFEWSCALLASGIARAAVFVHGPPVVRGAAACPVAKLLSRSFCAIRRECAPCAG